MPVRDVIIVGAGPSGLAAAIHAKQHNLDYQVLEQGVLVNSIYRFPPQMVFFTTPELLEIGGIPFMSPYEKPTRAESLNYYRKVVDKFDLSISYDETVLSITHASASGHPEQSEGSASVRGGGGAPPPVEKSETVFAIETRSRNGGTRLHHARFVVIAIGYYDHPVMLGIPGEDLPHVHHYYSEAHPYYRQRVVVVGGGNSAAEAALEMYRAGVQVTLVHRHPQLKSTIKYWVMPDIMNRIREQSIAARFSTCLSEIRPASVVVKGADGTEEIPADAVFLLTGYRADSDLMARAGVTFNERGAPHHNVETFETNVPNMFVAGGAIAGEDTGTVFIENGRFHGAKIIEEIARRM
jgi:thioredoxin reductase (NADPH)